MTLTTKSPNNTVLLKNETLLQISNMYFLAGRKKDIYICGTKLRKKKSLLSYPCDSNSLHMWIVVKEENLSGSYHLNQVSQKMVTFDFSDEKESKIYTMPLLHT